MSNKLSINVKLGDIIIPMKVSHSEEEIVRAAAKRVTEMFNAYTRDIPSSVDRMAVIAFYLALDCKKTEQSALSLEKLTDKIENYLSK